MVIFSLLTESKHETPFTSGTRMVEERNIRSGSEARIPHKINFVPKKRNGTTV